MNSSKNLPASKAGAETCSTGMDDQLSITVESSIVKNVRNTPSLDPVAYICGAGSHAQLHTCTHMLHTKNFNLNLDL